MEITEILNQIYALPAASCRKLQEKITEASFPKGKILLRARRVEKTVYFIRKGIVRAYAHQNDHEITFWFGQEGEAVISMNSYIQNKAGYEDIELLENCDLYCLRSEDLHRLYAEDIHIANWGRKFAERELLRTEARLISRQFSTASERYQELLRDHPDLLQRVQLGHIASYLGITQVSLSRIRSALPSSPHQEITG
ncbi:Crp/Fnr family transcriptional regulator [Flavilitoribacter nigricans]|uniref:Cyclic nucleotide-binding protein n=1 Tax=Flavilitoribacter nigricans (strain ATCC 23147 / DSM 23189 / NBRC 102662 / NCIMB 1420 / SS-2) TaxID=1122177 RepID=A0A2D0NJR1_FLAN2|nr:Crp/Fnr family transcriptional regulator [Flavilitoribacter nigricans]PHN07973.1 cyclic nucleotide-binding protein [Flavilitoribacter nigricans DSM 23189 = NBRC 102662]